SRPMAPQRAPHQPACCGKPCHHRRRRPRWHVSSLSAHGHQPRWCGMSGLSKMARATAMTVVGVGIGFVSSFAVGCESDRNDPYSNCNCSPARVRTTILGAPTSDDGDFPSLEGAWLNVQSTDPAPYDAEAPAAILEYFDSGDLVRVKF